MAAKLPGRVRFPSARRFAGQAFNLAEGSAEALYHRNKRTVRVHASLESCGRPCLRAKRGALCRMLASNPSSAAPAVLDRRLKPSQGSRDRQEAAG